MREAPFSPIEPVRRQRPSLGCWLLAGCLTLVSVTPLLAAPRKTARVTVNRAAALSSVRVSAPAAALAGNLDEQIRLLDSSAQFWQQSGSTIEGVDAKTAIVLSCACEEQARLLEARQAKIQGQAKKAAGLVKKAAAARKKWKKLVVPAAQPQMAGGMSGMEGMSGMPGMPGMEGMSGMPAPGMPGPEGMPPAPGMEGAPPGTMSPAPPMGP